MLEFMLKIVGQHHRGQTGHCYWGKECFLNYKALKITTENRPKGDEKPLADMLIVNNALH
jgi:hypothetical protein